MAGPDRSVHGGISAVVNGYFDAGLGRDVDLHYIGTMKEGSKLYKLFVALGAYVRFLSQLKKADIVHIHVASDSSFIRKSFFVRAAYKRRKHIIIHQHGGDLKNWIRNGGEKRLMMVRRILGMADRIIVISDIHMKIICELFDDGSDIREKIILLPNSVKIPSGIGDLSQKEKNSLLFLGRICKDKGIVELTEAIRQVKKTYPDVKLKVGGIYEEDLKEIVESEPDNIEYVGWVEGDEKDKLLSSSEIYVLPSYYEGQPVSVLEAMAAKCLVIASDVGGIPMMIKDHETGLLVTPGDTASLSQAIDMALSEEFSEDRVRICEAARQKTEQEYDIKTCIDKILRLYNSLCDAV